MIKKCCCCQIEKDVKEFGKDPHVKDGFKGRCKECRKKYYRDNHDRELARYKKNYQKNRKKSLEYYYKNREKILVYKRNLYKVFREKELERQKIYNQLSSTRTKINNRRKNKYINEPQHKLRAILRARLRKAVGSNQKAGSAVRDLGCSIAELKIWLENQFQPGMSWENWGFGDDKWHIDHIKPLHMFDLTDRKQFLEACHYTNLRPLWQKDNLTRTYEEFIIYEK